MKSDQFTLGFLDLKRRTFSHENRASMVNLPIKPYENVLEDLETLRLTELILNAKTLEQVIEVLKSVPYVYLPAPVSTRDITIELEMIQESLKQPSSMIFRFTFIVKRLPTQYGLRAKMYELLHTM